MSASCWKTRTSTAPGFAKRGLCRGSCVENGCPAASVASALNRSIGRLLLADTAALADVVKRLVEEPRLFVLMLGSVAGIVTRSDLAKPPTRMWLFGMISIIEMRFVRLIEDQFPQDGWREILSAGRLLKAEQLQAERQRRNRTVKLIDCLQLSDKGTIIIKSKRLRITLGIESKRRGEALIKRLEGLRNNLAHSQDIVETDWETIVLLSENLERVIEGPAEHPGLLES